VHKGPHSVEQALAPRQQRVDDASPNPPAQLELRAHIHRTFLHQSPNGLFARLAPENRQILSSIACSPPQNLPHVVHVVPHGARWH
jgi:hypothetical protein